MSISLTDARNLFTKKLIAVYKEKSTPKSFLRSFFQVDEGMTKEVSIEVQRGTEKVAVDVLRGTDGNRNTMSKSTEKLFVPPLYWDYIVANDHRLYDVAIGAQSADAISILASELADEMMMLKDKQERAYELQCSQALTTGIVQLEASTDIDYKRKALSLVDTSGATPWTTGTVDPTAQLLEGCNFLRQVGKSEGATINCIMGDVAFGAFINNTIIKERGDIRSFNLLGIREPQRNSVGASLHGQVACGSYMVNIWTYPEYYDTAAGVSTPYIDPKKVILLPEAPKFKLSFGAVPQLLDGSAPQKGAYMISEYFDSRKVAHEMHIKSAGVAIPVAVDQIYTRKVIA